MAICVLENWWLSIIRCFFGGGTCFSNKPICCHQKTEVSWVLYQSPENPSGMYGSKYVWDPIRSADFIGFYSYTMCLR
jgi:hypothetical protein